MFLQSAIVPLLIILALLLPPPQPLLAFHAVADVPRMSVWDWLLKQQRGEVGLHKRSKQPITCGWTPFEPHLDSTMQFSPARPYSWPWTVTLCGPNVFDEKHTPPSNKNITCSLYGVGSIVGPRWVLGAYMSPFGYPQSFVAQMHVRSGIYSWKNLHEIGSRRYNISRILAYPESEPPKDPTSTISLIELSSEIDFDERTQPICLATQDFPTTAGGWVSGWRWDTTFWPDFRETNMTQLRINQLNVPSSVPYGYYTLESHEGIMPPGAPLVRRINNRWYQHGVLNKDIEDATFFARIVYFCSWMEKTTRGQVSCVNGGDV